MMNAATRRDLLAGAAVGASALLGATTTRAADQVPEPSRAPGVGGTDPVPGDSAREAQDPDLLNPPETDSRTLLSSLRRRPIPDLSLISGFPSPMRISGSRAAAGRVRSPRGNLAFRKQSPA